MAASIMELVSRAHLTWKRQVARHLAPYGLNPKQIFVLRKLKESGGLAPSEIARLTYADRPTATSMLGTLERAGWISRRRDRANRKQVIVEITTRGRRKLASVPESLWRTGKTSFDPEGCFRRTERQATLKLLHKLNAWLENAPEHF